MKKSSYKKTKLSSEKRLACIESRFNPKIIARLERGVMSALRASGVKKSQYDTFSVPGAFEIPILLQKILKSGRYAGVVVLSTIVKGGTDHDQYVARALTDGISRLALDFETPVTYGVITAGNFDEALERSGGRHGNRGADAALALLEMVNQIEEIET